MDIARDDQDLLVVTDAGYGKRTRIDQYRKTSRGAMGVRTIKLTEAKGGLAGALVVREHQELVFISQSGMVQRTGVRGISQQGRAATGVRVMNVREDDCVRAIALVVESEPDAGAEELPLEGVDLGPEGNGASHEPEALGETLGEPAEDLDGDGDAEA
jgi:DNA gyrase subunit A